VGCGVAAERLVLRLLVLLRLRLLLFPVFALLTVGHGVLPWLMGRAYHGLRWKDDGCKPSHGPSGRLSEETGPWASFRFRRLTGWRLAGGGRRTGRRCGARRRRVRSGAVLATGVLDRARRACDQPVEVALLARRIFERDVAPGAAAAGEDRLAV